MKKTHLKKGLLFLFYTLFFLSSSTISAQSPDWTKNIGGSGEEHVQDFKMDRTNKAVMIGAFSATLNFETDGGVNEITPEGENSFYVQKRTISGDLEWVRKIDSEGQYLKLYSLEIDDENNIYIVGTFQGDFTIDFGTGSESISSINYQALVIKIAENGDLIWVKTPALPALSIAFDLTLSTSHLYFAGRCNGSNSDLFVQKMDLSGNEIWTKKMGVGVSNPGRVESIDIDNDGNVLISGFWQGTMDFDPSASEYSITSETYQDLFIAKYASNGDFIWAKSVEINIGLYWNNNELVVDQTTNDIYITSGFAFESDVDFDPGPDEYMMNPTGSNTDVGILKLNSNGEFIWARKIGNTHHNKSFDMEIDRHGDLWMTGYFAELVDFNSGPGVNNMTGVGIGNAFVLTLNSYGYFVWCAAYVGGEMGSLEVSFDEFGICYLAGDHTGATVENPAFNSFVLPPSMGGSDIFLSKIGAAAQLENHEINTGVSLFPNPAINVLNIKSEKKISQVNIYNLQGRLIATKQIVDGVVDIRDLENAVYVVKIEELDYAMRLMIQH